MKNLTVNEYLKNEYGKKIYKIAIDGGFTCPNRDGTLGTRGCIFCSGEGSGDFAESRKLSVTEQIEQGKARVINKMPKEQDLKFIAYFQAFTNTYAPVEKLRKLFTEAINHRDVQILSIATRPDCLGDDVIELLDELNKIKPVWVELGLQTIHKKSADYIRRGYELSVYDEVVKKLNSKGIKAITHVILGLPGEKKEDMLETVKYVGDSGSWGIKLQLLHILEGTDLAEDYIKGTFACMSMEEYVDLVYDCINVLPDDVIIHRMTGDGPKKILIAPKWSGDKKRVLNCLKKKLELR